MKQGKEGIPREAVEAAKKVLRGELPTPEPGLDNLADFYIEGALMAAYPSMREAILKLDDRETMELRARATEMGLVLTSRSFWEAASNAIRFMDAELRARNPKGATVAARASSGKPAVLGGESTE